jgi:hypothetical protein
MTDDRTEALRLARDLLRGQFAHAQSPETDLPGDFTTDYDDVINRALALATPPAEGLHHHDVNGVALWFDAAGKIVGGPADD